MLDSLCAWSAVTVLGGIAPTLWQFAAARFGFGLGSCESGAIAVYIQPRTLSMMLVKIC